MPGAVGWLIAQSRGSHQTSQRLSAIAAFDMTPASREDAYIFGMCPATLLPTRKLSDCYKFFSKIPP